MKGLDPGYETFEHGADIGIRGMGRSLDEAFVNGARAMFAITVENPEAVRPLETVEIRTKSYDREGLFVAWLNQLLAESDLRRMLFNHFQVNIEGLALTGLARGERIDPERHLLGIEVKGATFTALAVQETGGLWLAQCVVDV